jgi:tetratricopeptide (TPR) repeat protein
LLKRVYTTLAVLFIVFAFAGSTYLVFRLRTGVGNERREILYFWNNRDFEQVYEISRNALLQRPVDYFLLTINGFSAYQLGISQINNQNMLAFINESIFSLRKALIHKESANDGRLFYVLGKAYGYKGREFSDLAIKYLEKAKSLSYDAQDIPEFLGLAYAAAGDYRSSVAAFSQAFLPDRAPSDNLLLSIARSYMAMGEFDMAAVYLMRCVEISPDSRSVVIARFLLGEIYMLTGEYDKAEEQFLSIINEAGANAEVHFQLGELYNLKGDTTRARSEWRIANRLDPAHARARARLN